MTRERACLACEGTGAAGGDRYAETARLDTPRGRRMQVALYFEARRNPCPACLGTGRQTDAITAQDAIVDAETLRVIAHDAGCAYPYYLMDVRRFRGRNSITVHLRKWPGRAATMAREVARIACDQIEGLSC